MRGQPFEPKAVQSIAPVDTQIGRSRSIGRFGETALATSKSVAYIWNNLTHQLDTSHLIRHTVTPGYRPEGTRGGIVRAAHVSYNLFGSLPCCIPTSHEPWAVSVILGVRRVAELGDSPALLKQHVLHK